MSLFNINKYGPKYYQRHLDQYREWENSIGKSIVSILKPSSILDIGCGVGSYLEGALSSGCNDLLGLEISFDNAKEYIVHSIAKFIIKEDATKELNLNRTFDCVMSVEVAEHIEPDGTDQFITNLTIHTNKYIFFTAAPPGQAGTGHINMREKQWWIQEIEKRGFTHRQDLVDSFKTEWLKIKNVPKYIYKNLMVFSK